MKLLNLKIQGGIGVRPIVEIDGKEISFKQNKHEAIIIKHQTDSEAVNLKITNVLEVNGPCWWLVQMCLFIISCFGIFNPRMEKLCFLINYEAKVFLPNDENNVTLKLCQMKDRSKVIEVLEGEKLEEVANECTFDTKASKRKKWLKFSYVISWILLLGVIITLACLKIF